MHGLNALQYCQERARPPQGPGPLCAGCPQPSEDDPHLAKTYIDDRPGDRRADPPDYLNRGNHVTAKCRAGSPPSGRQDSVRPLMYGQLLARGRVLDYHWGRGGGVREGERRGVAEREGKKGGREGNEGGEGGRVSERELGSYLKLSCTCCSLDVSRERKEIARLASPPTIGISQVEAI